MSIRRIRSDKFDAYRNLSIPFSEGSKKDKSFRLSLILVEMLRIVEILFAVVVERYEACGVREEHGVRKSVSKFRFRRERFVISLERSDSCAECSHVTCGGDLIIGIRGMIIEHKRARKDLHSRAQSPHSTGEDNIWSWRNN